MCGTTTAGSGECYWDCRVVLARGSFPLFSNPECLQDCFPQDHCVNRLLNHYVTEGGICNVQTQFDLTAIYPIVPDVMGQCFNNTTGLPKGLCSDETEELLKDDNNCFFETIDQNPPMLANTIFSLNLTMCYHLDRRTSNYNTYFDSLMTPSKKHKKKKRKKSPQSSRLNPLYEVGIRYTDGKPYRSTLELEHTRHRYPWICSLRSRRSDKIHYCAATLLRRPPGPTVLVTAAHCTFLCKSGANVVDNCCCENVSGVRCDNSTTCGDNPAVVEMTGEDVEVVCGEWEIGDTPYSTSGEKYNIVLQIKVIFILVKYVMT